MLIQSSSSGMIVGQNLPSLSGDTHHDILRAGHAPTQPEHLQAHGLAALVDIKAHAGDLNAAHAPDWGIAEVDRRRVGDGIDGNLHNAYLQQVMNTSMSAVCLATTPITPP